MDALDPAGQLYAPLGQRSLAHVARRRCDCSSVGRKQWETEQGERPLSLFLREEPGRSEGFGSSVGKG